MQNHDQLAFYQGLWRRPQWKLRLHPPHISSSLDLSWLVGSLCGLLEDLQ